MKTLLDIVIILSIITNIIFIGYRLICFVMRGEKTKRFRNTYGRKINQLDYLRIFILLPILGLLIFINYSPTMPETIYKQFIGVLVLFLISFLLSSYDDKYYKNTK